MRAALGVLTLALAVGVAPRVAWAAQDERCAPVEVGAESGVYFLVLGGECTIAQAEGYSVVAHLVRDDDESELLVLLDAAHTDDESQMVAQLVAGEVKEGKVDDHPWHAAPADEQPANVEP